jgi:hypothetical protein
VGRILAEVASADARSQAGDIRSRRERSRSGIHAGLIEGRIDIGVPSLTANIGWLGPQHVWENGGSAYFPKRIVQPYLKASRLIGKAPEFSMPAYVVYLLDCDRDLFSIPLEIRHGVAKPKATIRSSRTHPKGSRRVR